MKFKVQSSKFKVQSSKFKVVRVAVHPEVVGNGAPRHQVCVQPVVLARDSVPKGRKNRAAILRFCPNEE
jgi:hypothetical protein